MNKYYKDYRQEFVLPDSHDYIHIMGKGYNDATNAFCKALEEMEYKIPRSVVKLALRNYNNIENAIQSGIFNKYIQNPKELLQRNLDESWEMIQELKSKSDKQKWEMKIGEYNSFAKMYDSNNKGVKIMKKFKSKCFKKDSLNKMKKPMKKDTWKGEDVIADLVDRAKMFQSDGYDIEEAIEHAIDEGLIYTADIHTLLEHYGSIDDSEIIESYYDDLYSDMYEKLEDNNTEDGCSKKDRKTKRKIKKDSITIEIDEDEAVDMLMNRLEEYWTKDSVVLDLYRKYYEDLVYSGDFDDVKFDISDIVDNDYVNYCEIIRKGEDTESEYGFTYEDVVKAYKEDGLGAEVGDFTIEAENNGNFLLRR